MDDSGTHKKELKLWATTLDSNVNAWYREAGQGMGKVLQMADELNPEHYPELNLQGAKALINWLISPSGQKLIGDYRLKNTRQFTLSADPSQLAETKR